jgi:hypothetical protein
MSNSPETPSPSVSEQMPALAAEFVQTCKAAGLALDYLPRTLPLVDRFVNGVRAQVQQLSARRDPAAAGLQSKHAMSVTAYLGEVILRETAGSWYDFDGRPFLNAGDYQADPLTVVMTMFERGKAQEGDLTIESTKAYCELICRMQRLWLDGTVLATYESMTALRTSMTPDARLAGWLVAQAQLAVKSAKMQWQESLDFSADSLDAVERILGAIHTRSRGAPENTVADQALVDEANKWGVYLGEVIRRRYGGRWSMSADGAHQVDLSGTSPQPISKVRKRIVDGASDNVRVYFFAIPKAMRS